MRPFLAAALAASVLFSASAAFAAEIKINFVGTQPPVAGVDWNNITSAALNAGPSALTDNTGAPTAVTIDGSGGDGYSDFISATAATEDWVLSSAQLGGAGLFSGESALIAFDGLIGASYMVEVVSARDCCDYLNYFSIGGDIADRTYTGAPVPDPWGSLVNGLNPTDWLIWDNVAPIGGTITLSHIADGLTLGVVNAIRISDGIVPPPVPLPAGVVLLLSAMAGLGALRGASSRRRAV
jgi:hypothetical protein